MLGQQRSRSHEVLQKAFSKSNRYINPKNMSEPISYLKSRQAVAWGERHGLLQFPRVTYPNPIGIDPTTGYAFQFKKKVPCLQK